jgi:hypothetical protein
MVYLQKTLVYKINFEENDDRMTDCIMGLDSILTAGRSRGIKDFMSYDEIDKLINLLLKCFSKNVK